MVWATKTSLNLQEDFLSLAAIQAGVKCIDAYQIKDDLIGSSVSGTVHCDAGFIIALSLMALV